MISFCDFDVAERDKIQKKKLANSTTFLYIS